MKLLVLLVFPLTATSLSTHRIKRYPNEKVVYTATDGYNVNHEEKTPQQTLLNAVVYQPQYEQRRYDLVQNAELVCCITEDSEGNAEGNSFPCYVSSSKSGTDRPIKYQSAEPHPMEYREMADIFRNVMAETLLKIIGSLLNIFDEPTNQHNPHRSVKGSSSQSHRNVPRNAPKNSLPHPFTKLNKPSSRSNTVDFHPLSGQPIKGPNGELLLQN